MHTDTSPRRATLPLIIAVCALAPTVASVLYIHVAGSTGATQGLYFASKAAIFSLPLLWWLFAERRGRRKVPTESAPSSPPQTRVPLRRDVVAGLATGVLIGLLIWAGYWWGLRTVLDAELLGERVRRFGADEHYILFALFLAVVNSGLEEYYWRWFVFGRMKTVVGSLAAVMLSSLAFALHHCVVLENFLNSAALAALGGLCIAVGGAVWALHYQRSNRLWGVWLSHCLVDLAIFTVGYHLLF